MIVIFSSSVNETWLDSTISDQEVCIDGYTLVRCDRSRHGGGVALYIRSVIPFRVRNDLTLDREPKIKSCRIEIETKKIRSSYYFVLRITLHLISEHCFL